MECANKSIFTMSCTIRRGTRVRGSAVLPTPLRGHELTLHMNICFGKSGGLACEHRMPQSAHSFAGVSRPHGADQPPYFSATVLLIVDVVPITALKRWCAVHGKLYPSLEQRPGMKYIFQPKFFSGEYWRWQYTC